MKFDGALPIPFKLVNPPAKVGDFGLDGEDRPDFTAPSQLDQPRRQPLGAGKRLSRFSKPPFLNLIARLDPIHTTPSPGPANSKLLPESGDIIRTGHNLICPGAGLTDTNNLLGSFFTTSFLWEGARR